MLSVMNTQKTASQSLIYLGTFILTAFLLQACSTGSNSNSGSEKLFDSGNIAPDATFSYTFQEEGTVDYYCEIHAPDMQGVVQVNAGAEITDRDTVEMINNQFNPSQITVAPGTEIVWINRAAESHTVVEGNPSTRNGDDY